MSFWIAEGGNNKGWGDVESEKVMLFSKYTKYICCIEINYYDFFSK